MSLAVLRFDEIPEQEFTPWHEEAIKRMSDVHANRKREWALARVCLARTFAEHGIRLEPSQAIFKNHHELTHLAAWRFSLSHSKDVAAAWLMPANQVRSLGLDVELVGRKVPPQVKARLSHPQDEKLSDLALWGLKEAAYKALPSLAQQDIWLNRIIIRDHAFELEGSPFKGTWELTSQNGSQIAQALLS